MPLDKKCITKNVIKCFRLNFSILKKKRTSPRHQGAATQVPKEFLIEAGEIPISSLGASLFQTKTHQAQHQ